MRRILRRRKINYIYKNDLPDDLILEGDIAVDTEAMGLQHNRDRLCLVQLSNGDGNAHLVQISIGQTSAPNLKKLLENKNTTKIMHFARFDYSIIKKFLNIDSTPIFCTKIASKLCRTYTDRHGLKELCRELVGTEISKQQQSSDWGADELSPEQIEYAASDVLYLHKIKERLENMLIRENRVEIAQKCFDFLPTRVELDHLGWPETDIFAHRD